MISKTQFQAASNQEESFGESLKNKSFRCLYATGEELRGNTFPWHWHSSFEIDLVTGSDTRFDFAGKSVKISAGSAVFINSQKIHSYQPENLQNCQIYALLFEPVLLAGEYNNAIFRKYVAPVMNSEVSGVEIPAGDMAFPFIQEIIRLAKEEPPYFEIQIRVQLEKFWCTLLEKMNTIQISNPVKKEDSVRIKEMLNYIHTHYGEALSLEKIAAAASIGTRECSRCFQRSIRRTPMDYVNSYRVQVAMELLSATDHTVTEISELCGFSSISYFGKVFRQLIGCSPVQYRNELHGS